MIGHGVTPDHMPATLALLGIGVVGVKTVACLRSPPSADRAGSGSPPPQDASRVSAATADDRPRRWRRGEVFFFMAAGARPPPTDRHATVCYRRSVRFR